MENKNSFFRPYYDYLPEISKSEYPIYFSEEEKISFNKIELETQIRRQEFFFNKRILYMSQLEILEEEALFFRM